MPKTTKEINDKLGVQFSLSFLIQVLATVIIAVWGYSQLDARITTAANEVSSHAGRLLSIESDLKENQDKPIPSDHVQNTTLVAHTQQLDELKLNVQIMEDRIYEHIVRAHNP
jgi:hypothetical protein